MPSIESTVRCSNEVHLHTNTVDLQHSLPVARLADMSRITGLTNLGKTWLNLCIYPHCVGTIQLDRTPLNVTRVRIHLAARKEPRSEPTRTRTTKGVSTSLDSALYKF
jgi:hypothetical protein